MFLSFKYKSIKDELLDLNYIETIINIININII